MYHKLDETHKDFLTVTRLQFRKQMQHIKSHYNPVRLSEVLNHIRTGKPLPEKAVLISFDDGYENNYSLAWPVLKDLQIPFAVFPVAAFIGESTEYDGQLQRFMSAEQLREMSGLAEYGYHGHTHASFLKLSEAGREEEIRKTLDHIRSTGLEFQPAWAYTYGAHPRRNKAAAAALQGKFRDYGIICAFRIGNRTNKLPLKRPFAIQRIDIRGTESYLSFSLKVRFGKII